jgi:hypothetical protein
MRKNRRKMENPAERPQRAGDRILLSSFPDLNKGDKRDQSSFF